MTQKAVILAAGASTRLRPLTNHLPKCLLPLGSKTILDWQMESLLRVGVKEITMVVGYQQDLIRLHVRRKYASLPVQFTVNEEFMSTNTLDSLSQALRIVEGDFYYLNADVVFHPDILMKLSTGSNGGYLAIDKKQCREEEVKVLVQGNRSIGKHLPPEHCEGEFIGVARFTGKFAEDFRESVLMESTRGNAMAYFEHALDTLSDKSDLIPVDITGFPCVEVDFPEDYARAIHSVIRQIQEDENDRRTAT